MERPVRAAFARTFGREPAGIALAPGRVNLIGEHTDYNDGFALPMAIDRGVRVAVALRTDGLVRAHAAAFDETCEIDVAALAPGRLRGWSAYVGGVVWMLTRTAFPISGADLAIVSDLPIGAGLSSSAALELAVMRALAFAAGAEWDARAMAARAREAEHEFVGVACGVMDQFASALGRSGCALLLDCRSLGARPVPVPADAAVVVMDTAVRRALSSSAYNARRAACARAVAAVRKLAPDVAALRDVDAALLARARDRMDDEAFRRASHVVAENGRPAAMAERLGARDLAGAGRLMHDSHASLRDLYEVSCPELDAMVTAAERQPSCYGARLTGAGFGGCAIALVASAQADDFVAAVEREYARDTGRTGTLFVVQPSDGAHLADPAGTA
ncbi:MAG: galactokinase [Betaproteobacteria bacterium]